MIPPQHTRQTSLLILLLFLLSTALHTGCTPAQRKSAADATIKQAAVRPAKVSDRNYGSIAVYDINIKHPTARLVYRSENVRDRIARGLHESGGFRVIDWQRLEEVLFRRNLQSSDLVTNVALRKEIGDLLLNDYFLQGTVTSYGEHMEYSSSALSKEKTQVVNVELELFVKNALTNEVLASANGSGSTQKKITQTLGFGAAGGNDTVSAQRALDIAVDNAIAKLLTEMKHVPPPSHVTAQASKAPARGKFIRQPHVKVLVILAETEELVDNKLVSQADSDTFTSSTVEKALAKVFSDADYQVLTADDVLGKAYGVIGDENILLSGWVNEQDIEEFENLLQARTGLASYALKVGRMAHADIVISGEVKYQLTRSSGAGNVQARTTNVVLSAKALQVKEQKTYHIALIKDSFTAVLQADTMKARETALIKAATDAGWEILSRTPKLK